MSRDLMSQINSRADSMRNINDMANDSRGGFFGDFKNTITNDYQGALEDYADKMNVDVSKEIASRSESFGILSQTPTLYASGKVGYATLGPKGKKPFDIVGRAVKRRFGKTIESVDKQVKSFQSNVKNFPEHIKNVMSGAEEEVQEPLVITRADGTTSTRLLDAASRERGGFAAELDKKSTNQLKAIQSPESTETTESPESTETDGNVMRGETKINDGAYRIGKSPSAETKGSNLSKDLTAAAEGDEDVIEGAAAVPVVGEVGEAVAGVGLALIGVVAGLSTLFSHRSHHPNRPTYNATQPAFQSRYNPSASVLANVNNTTNQATMSF